MAEFEVLIGQLFHHTPESKDKLDALKAKLSDLAHAYCGTPVDIGDFSIPKDFLQTIKSLRLGLGLDSLSPYFLLF